MPEALRQHGSQAVLARKDFDSILQALQGSHHRLLGPTLLDGSVVYDLIESAADLPIGFNDLQEAASYRLVESDLPTLFAYAVGQHSWKRFLYPPEESVWQASRSGGGFKAVAGKPAPEPQALIGVRACELAALDILDAVLSGGPYTDPAYRLRRERSFVLAVNCTRPGGTCFCASMETGPRATSGFDLALTEVCDDRDHYFVIETGSEKGADLLSGLPVEPAGERQIETAARLVDEAKHSTGRELDTKGLNELLSSRFDSLRWEETARRCLTCANCTMVCPTCFCTTVLDSTDLPGGRAERRRLWDSCYAVDFSYVHGGSIRSSAAARYRQWLSHKLGYWQDQFGRIGCVGCGRCITWCPAAIDITEEVRALRADSADVDTA